MDKHRFGERRERRRLCILGSIIYTWTTSRTSLLVYVKCICQYLKEISLSKQIRPKMGNYNTTYVGKKELLTYVRRERGRKSNSATARKWKSFLQPDWIQSNGASRSTYDFATLLTSTFLARVSCYIFTHQFIPSVRVFRRPSKVFFVGPFVGGDDLLFVRLSVRPPVRPWVLEIFLCLCSGLVLCILWSYPQTNKLMSQRMTDWTDWSYNENIIPSQSEGWNKMSKLFQSQS